MEKERERKSDKVSRSQVASLLSRKSACLQLEAVLCGWSRPRAVTEQPANDDRGVQQGAPESPLEFVVVTDDIFGGSETSGQAHGRMWTFFFLGRTVDILLS